MNMDTENKKFADNQEEDIPQVQEGTSEEQEEFEDGLGGNSAQTNSPDQRKGSKEGNALIAQLIKDPNAIQQYRDKAQDLIGQFGSRREVLENEVDTLAECVAIAAEIYRSFPIPDNAYQLSSLTNAHNSSLSQLEKMRDPKLVMKDIEVLIKGMFMSITRSLALEIDKTKKELSHRFPDEKTTIELAFNRIFTSVSPEAQNVYDGMQESLKKALGIKDARKKN